MGYDKFDIVKDSSIWRSTSDHAATIRKDAFIRLGLVKEVFRDTGTTDIRYLVAVQDMSDGIEVNARMMRKFGGPYNYEDVVMHGYKFDDSPDSTNDFAAKPGDTVVVAFLNGEARDAIILGGVLHPSRESTLSVDDGPQYESEFNGIKKSINQDGEFTITFRGVPTNSAKLDDKPTKLIAAPTYDLSVGTTYMKFDKTGSWEINDNAQSDPQNVRIDKPGGFILVNSGQIALKMTKAAQSVTLKCKTLAITADDSVNETTKTWAVDASTSASIKSPKIAFGTSSIELLDQLAQLVDALGKVTPISPVGPCSPLMSTPEWPAVDAIKAKIKEITGSVS